MLYKKLLLLALTTISNIHCSSRALSDRQLASRKMFFWNESGRTVTYHEDGTGSEKQGDLHPRTLLPKSSTYHGKGKPNYTFKKAGDHQEVHVSIPAISGTIADAFVVLFEHAANPTGLNISAISKKDFDASDRIPKAPQAPLLSTQQDQKKDESATGQRSATAGSGSTTSSASRSTTYSSTEPFACKVRISD